MIISKNNVLKVIFTVLLLSIKSTWVFADKSISIMLFGDSLMSGYGLSQSENLASQIGNKFLANNKPISVINASVSGNTSSNGLARLDWSLADNPDIVILCLGANDMLRGISPELTQKNLDKIIKTIKSTGSIVILAGMRAPENMGPDYQAQFDKVYLSLAEKYALIFMPFLLEGVALEKDYLQSDYKHPNAEGVKIMVNNLYPFINQSLSVIN